VHASAYLWYHGDTKGVMLTHGNITWNVINFLLVVDFRSDDVTIAIAPFFRTGGTGVNVLPVLFTGGTVIIPEAPDPDEILRLIEERRVTIGFGNPDLLETLTRSPGWPTADFSSAAISPVAHPSRSASSGDTCNEVLLSCKGMGSTRRRHWCCSSIQQARYARWGPLANRRCSSTSGLSDPTAPLVSRTRPASCS
jgi:acyl-CoA synthetase (AMP-forming)/AMP-acid ligase II